MQHLIGPKAANTVVERGPLDDVVKFYKKGGKPTLKDPVAVAVVTRSEDDTLARFAVLRGSPKLIQAPQDEINELQAQCRPRRNFYAGIRLRSWDETDAGAIEYPNSEYASRRGDEGSEYISSTASLQSLVALLNDAFLIINLPLFGHHESAAFGTARSLYYAESSVKS
jgi:hypothetical protein